MSQSSSMPASLSTVEDSTQAMGLEGTDLLWMRAISKDPIEQDRLYRLTAQVAFQFLESNYKDAKSIAEVVLLGSVLDRQDYRGVLSSLVRQLEQEPLLESAVLVGVVYFLESAPPGYLIDDDLVRILKVLRKRLEDTHMQLGDTKKPASEPIYLLAIAISRVLDKMVQGNIKGLRRTEDHRPLLNVLAGLKDSSDLCLKYQATCAWQALQYIGDDESPLDMAVRVGGGLVMASLSVAGAFKLDVEGLFNGLRELGEAAGQIRDATETMIAGVQTAREAGEGVVDSLLKGFRTGNKRAWYPALQGARVVISEGRLAEFRRIVYEAPCCHLQEFQWGICQLLGEIAMDPIWVMEIRLQAVYFLENLLRSDSEWTTDSSVKEAIRSILLRISTSGEKTIQIHFNSLSQDSRRENGDDSAEPYPLITRLPTPRSSPLLAKALKAPSLEYELHRFMAHRLEAHQQAAYIPPYAKAHLTASDERFPLMDKVMEFLKSDRQVFLILGDSGSGKTTFNKHLEYVLIKDYKQGSPIPLFIYLPAIRNPEKELISEQLKTLNFTNNDIQELKRDRQFIIICDSYDESRLKINLHMTNMLNQPGQWNVKLIISCRSTHTSANRLHYFQPQPSPVDRYGPSTLHLFQQAVIVPFSEGQIQDYVDQFVRDTELHKALDLRSVWSTAEYMDKLTRIPNLLALVTNPFLLNLSLRSLPVAFKDDLDPLTIARMTRPKLYGIFIDEWLKVNIHRLLCMKHNEATTTKLNELIEAGFNQIAIDFLQNLAKAIYKEQAGNSVVRYVHRDDKETWKAKFFGPEEESTLLRQSSPLTCVENLHSFMHRSLLEYFRSLQMAKLVPTINKRENERVETRSRSMSQTNNQQADLLQKYSTTNDQRKQNNPPSPSLTPSPHQYTQHMMAFSISNALDPESSFTSTNFLANNLERNTLRDACADTSLDAESDGSVSSDDEFEDAQEYLSSDPLERITQDEPHKSFCIRWEEHKVSVSERFTFEVKNYEIVEESSWFRRAVSGVGAAAIGAGALVVGVVRRAAFGAGHAAETDYKLDGPPETVESAKPAFQVTYHENFGVQWEERETAVSESFTYEVKTYETFECVEEIEEIVEETEVVAIIAHEQEIVTEDEVITTETTTTTEGETVLEHVQKDVIVDKKVEVDVDVSVEVVDVEVEKKEAKEIIITKETGVVAKPAAPQGTSWFRKIATATGAAVVGAGAVAVGAGALAVGAAKDDASGAGHAAHGALEKVDGVWKRTVQVLTTRKAHVDTVAPIAKTSYVYYDDEVYDAVLVDKSTGVTHVTQLLYDTTTTKYYVYYRWGETDYKLDGPHETVESAKTAFQVTYHENFGVQWEERETAVSERFTYEVKTYETFETIEEVEEIVEETEAVAIIAREQEIVTEDEVITTETTTTTTTTTEGETVLEHVQKDVIVDKKVEVDVDVSVEVVDVEVEKKEAKDIIITKETGVVTKPAVPKGTSWFRKIATATGATAVGAGAVAVGAVAVAVDTVHDDASGAGHAAHGALEKVDGVWKRSVQVLTTRKANVDAVTPIAKTSYVYYDDEVYDAVLVEKSTGITYVTQLLFDSATTKYYVYVRWGETDYKLDGPHDTVESAKAAFQVTYYDQFGVKWQERATTVSERFTYEVKTYETFEAVEVVEEVVDEKAAEVILKPEQEVIVDEETVQTETTTSTTTAHKNENVAEIAYEVEAAPSSSFLKCEISGIPESLGDLTTTSLVFEMRDSPIFDDESLGAMDLEEEQDILQFLVEQVHEDTDYTKLLLWTVYKSLTEGIINQSTKNAACILEKAGIQFQPQL
ncbi:hypothetical protein EC957_009285 [Mortierella hygrophila]|uniref:NAD(+) ADP-ribosyltransferase n=1 Tax=Mortierella hygrophila TaxID=979708 RepID=A0A9P6K569_9FUNG|nr:hypothetical protein EC957_009285 [Mortierella hygrophila]